LKAALSLDLAGNAVMLDGSLAPDTRNGAQDRWALTLNAPAVARAGPVLRMVPGLSESGLLNELGGALSVDAKAGGRWPEINLQGRADVGSLKAGPLSLSQGHLQWQLGSLADAPLDLQLDIAEAGWGPQQFGGTKLSLKGSAKAHEVSLRTELKAAPPAWLDNLQGQGRAPAPSTFSRTQVLFNAQGSLSGGVLDGRVGSGSNANAATPPLAWKGTVQQLELRGTQASTPLLATRNVELEMRGGTSPRFTMSAGRADILGNGLRWDRIEWEPEQGLRAQQLDMHAELEPFAVAPLLQRLQPDFGWNGDLKIAGKIAIKQAAEFSADIVLERAGGDLTVTDESGTQALGLTDLVLALSVEHGEWTFTQGLAGKQLGVATGAFTTRTSPQRAWPDPNAPLQGVLEARVDNLGTWGAWVPTGWRLGGQLRTTAGVSGRFGAPEYTGQVKGNDISVRNLLQGVNITQGSVDISLRGDSARINNFTANAGSGTVKLSGDAKLGAAPQAQLQLVAEKFQLLGRVDRRIVASGQGQVLLDRENLKVEGKFNVDEGLFDFTRADAPSLGSDVVVARGDAADPQRGSQQPQQPGAGPNATQRNSAINLQFDLGQHLRLRGRGIDTLLQGDVKITNPNGLPSWVGSVRAVDGTYAAYGQKLKIDRGVITFNGPPADPKLDILATRQNLDVQVGVTIGGTALNPRVKLYSQPEMSDIDKLSWLMLGRASEGLGTSDSALLQRAAMALLAGDNPSVTDQVLHSIGIDDLSIRQSEGSTGASGGEVRDTFVSLGRQLSRRWYVGYERGLNATTGTWQLIYRVAQRFTGRAQSGLDNSLDMIWTWKWH
jgi:translocation and assembly module TamB